MNPLPTRVRLRRRVSRARSIRLLLASLWLLAAVPATAGTDPAARSLRVAVVLDDSGSMRHTDQRRLSITAAMIAVQLADASDRLALVPLSGRAAPLSPGGADRALLGRLRDLQRRAAATIYDAPLRRALQLLAGQPGTRLVLFLTDGEPDPGPGRDRERERMLASHEAFLRGLAARPPGPQIYPVLLGTLGERWRELFAQVAQRSGGKLFSVADSDALVEVFADIYARQLGSRVVVQDLTDGSHTLATVDDFVRHANLVVISRSGPFSVSLPGAVPTAAVIDSGADRGSAAAPVYHYVDKLRPSGPTALQLTLRSSGGRGNYRALLIWDYDLALHLARPAADAQGAYPLRARLSRRSGAPIDEQRFLRGMRVSARVCRETASGACTEAPALALRCDAAAGEAAASGRCRFVGTFRPDRPGRYLVDAVARRDRGGKTVIEMHSLQRHVLDVSGDARLSVDGDTVRYALDQNQGRAPWRSCRPVAVQVAGQRPVRLRLDTPGLALPGGVQLRLDGADSSGVVRVSAGRQRLRLCLVADELVDRPGLEVSGTARLQAMADDATWFASGGDRADVPVQVGITACSWWNRYRRLLLCCGLGLLLLLLLIWLVRGFVSPHSFPEALKVNWGKSLDRLDRNEMPVSELSQARRGFYRNAQLWIGSGRCFIHSGWPPYARFEATGSRSISLLCDSGTEVLRVNKFDPDKRDPVSSGSLVSLGDAYLVNDLFVRLKL